MWGLQVLLVNVYVLYCSAHIIIWKTDKKNTLDQYKFREEIVKSWMNEENEATLPFPDPATKQECTVWSLPLGYER